MGKRLNVRNAPLAPGPPAVAKRMTSSGPAPQARMAGPDKWGITVYRCSRHENVDYKVKGVAKPVCPVCEEVSKTEGLRIELRKLANANDILQQELGRLKMQLTYLDGMREAVSELNDQDQMFLKELIYRYRANPKEVGATQKIEKRTVRIENQGTVVRHDVVGITVSYKDVAPPERREWEASSIGGKMICLQFSEALKVTGLRGAMEALTKAMSASMANADA